MADIVDEAASLEAEHVAISIAKRAPSVAGTAAGLCETCELPSPALFEGECAWCHDGRERPEEKQPEPLLTIKRLPTRPSAPRQTPSQREAKIANREERRQLNVHFPASRYAEVERIAAERNQAPSAWAREIVIGELDRLAAGPNCKPFISAAVIRAARAANQPLDVFVTALIVRGLAEHQASQERRA